MNRLQELLVILAEECAEVQQVASKSIRFGIDAVYQDVSNRTRLEQELGDFMAMFKLVLEEAHLSGDHIMECAEAKLIKVEKFMTNGKPQGSGGKRKPIRKK
jgi:NTP pyrophosphatase (non-canonical NTP hydrolase)